jgi:type IV pilus assembly protein PilV
MLKGIVEMNRIKNKSRVMPLQQMQNKQQGSILLEALIAVLIFSFGILAISGLQGAMMKNTADATFRAEASYVVQQYIGSMIANPYGYGQGMELDVESLPNGLLFVDSLSDGRLRFRVTWQTPGAEEHQYSNDEKYTKIARSIWLYHCGADGGSGDRPNCLIGDHADIFFI